MKKVIVPPQRVQPHERVAPVPYMVWAVLFTVVPLLFIAYYALTDNQFHFTFDNITRFFTATSTMEAADGTQKVIHTYLLIFWRSFKLALISTAVCLLMGYPIAYIIARASPKAQSTMITLIMIPMWMNFLIRTYAWMTILQDTGILNGILSALHLGTVKIIGTEGAVVVGMVYDFLPYMILPIYSVMAKMDTRLLEAARDLGCNSLGVLRRVIFPLSLPGVFSGITMVLVPSISTFYISQKLGNGKIMLIGDTIERQMQTLNNYNLGAALSLVLMVLILVSMFIMNRFADNSGEGGLVA